MRVASVFFLALVLGAALGGAISRLDASEPVRIAKEQDRPALDSAMHGVAAARLLRE